MWVPIVNRIFSPDSFRAFVLAIATGAMQWKPSGIVLHNTAEPSLSQWGVGGWQRHVKGLEAYYRDEQRWHAGPHLFVAPEGIIAFSPLTQPGVHSPSWNGSHIGVEMVGNYVSHGADRFDSGAGLTVHTYAMSALATLCERFGIDSGLIKLHREDPLTTHACPGDQVQKPAVLRAVHDELVRRRQK